MKDIDKTKQNIKVTEIDANQRNDLFKKFKDAGGQVIDAQNAKKKLTIDREKQKEHQKTLDRHYTDKTSSQRKKSTNTSDKDQSKSASNDPISSMLDRFKIRIRLILLGITGFNPAFLKNSFLRKFVNYYKPSLITIQMIHLALFKKNPQVGNRIIRDLDKISPRYYELIEMTGELYNQELIDQIIEDFKNFPNIPQSISELKEPIVELYRALYILKPYENGIYNAFEQATRINSTFDTERVDWNFKHKDLRNSLFFIFEKLYPRLHIIFCYYQGVLYGETDAEIEEILSVAKSEKPGTRIKQNVNNVQQHEKKSGKAEKSDEADESDETEKTDEADETPEHVKKDNSDIDHAIKEGLKLMYKLDHKMLRLQYDKRNEFELLSNTDKALLTYLLFKEFENEFSFILTTNKIRYNLDYSTNVKIDYRTKMQDIFNKLNKCQEAFKNYYDVQREYDKIMKEPPTDSNQYMAYSKKLDEMITKKNHAGLTYRSVIKAFMDHLAAELSILINDMNSEKRFIANPQDVLQFNQSIEGEKKLNKVKVYEAIIILYNFASAFSYRISHRGDLSGKSEFNENEKLIDIEEESPKKNPEYKEDKENKKNEINKDDKDDRDYKDKKTLIDELNDLV